ncbi:MAG: flagellin FliC [Moraxellaceae bacterium]|nr:flagellin FliC [Pseudobdellovibrionaceae bacterium]
MGLRITTNIPAINGQRHLGNSQRIMARASEQLASGYRINKSADDAAGLAISETMKAQIRSAGQAKRNANDGISLVQTAEGSLGEISNMLMRLRELSIQGASDTIADNERSIVNTEVQQLKNEIERTARTTSWNTTKLLDGSSPTFQFQIGLFNTENDSISFDSGANVATLDALGLTDVNHLTKESSRQAIDAIDIAGVSVNTMRAKIGALQSRLTSTYDVLAVTEENLMAANSRIRDTDIAASTADMARSQVLLQAGAAVLTQANQNNQLALKLIG